MIYLPDHFRATEILTLEENISFCPWLWYTLRKSYSSNHPKPHLDSLFLFKINHIFVALLKSFYELMIINTVARFLDSYLKLLLILLFVICIFRFYLDFECLDHSKQDLLKTTLNCQICRAVIGEKHGQVIYGVKNILHNLLTITLLIMWSKLRSVRSKWNKLR